MQALITRYLIAISAISITGITWLGLRDISVRDSGSGLILLDIQSIHHPTIGAEWDERTGELHSPKLTLVQIGTRDGKHSFFVRGAIDPHDAEMLVRVKEPDPDTQLRFDREP